MTWPTWIGQMIKRKTVAWKHDELNYHNIYFLAKLVGAGKNIFIFAGYLSILASLCNTHLPRLQIIICKNNHKLYLPLVYYSHSQVLPQSPFQSTIILCHNSAVCLFVIFKSGFALFYILQVFLLQTFDRIRLFWQSCLSNIQMFHNVKLLLIYKFIIVAFSLVQKHIFKRWKSTLKAKSLIIGMYQVKKVLSAVSRVAILMNVNHIQVRWSSTDPLGGFSN